MLLRGINQHSLHNSLRCTSPETQIAVTQTTTKVIGPLVASHLLGSPLLLSSGVNTGDCELQRPLVNIPTSLAIAIPPANAIMLQLSVYGKAVEGAVHILATAQLPIHSPPPTTDTEVHMYKCSEHHRLCGAPTRNYKSALSHHHSMMAKPDQTRHCIYV